MESKTARRCFDGPTFFLLFLWFLHLANGMFAEEVEEAFSLFSVQQRQRCLTEQFMTTHISRASFPFLSSVSHTLLRGVRALDVIIHCLRVRIMAAHT